MSGAERIPHLEKVAKEKGVTIYTETRGTELLVDSSGKVVGAKAEQTDGTQITINTKTVLYWQPEDIVLTLKWLRNMTNTGVTTYQTEPCQQTWEPTRVTVL